ncbi:unnamed protein product [Diatraea saccharalis]|uniref:FP protein C-terminal domain-containing protein n=1 Tax=Diatraea saccharalis TaxID=40085 RepID=A0A9N9R535_9NEOP|nr:unnamed protein product [Diatraea saccharalis]
MYRTNKTSQTGNVRKSTTTSPNLTESRKERIRRSEERTMEELILLLTEILNSIPKQIYSAMKREVKESLEKTTSAGLNTLNELRTKIINREEDLKKEIEREKENKTIKDQIEEMKKMMKEDMEKITKEINYQQETTLKHREEKRRRREDDESVTTKFLRMIDYKLENIKNREEALFDRLADRSLKDSEFVIATVIKKLDAVEENLTAEKIKLDRRIGERLGGETETIEGETNMRTNSEIERQIKETGKEITAEITKTIDTVMTECMQDLHNAITYSGTSPEENSVVIKRIDTLETNIKDEIQDTKEEIAKKIDENKTTITKHIETTITKEVLTHQPYTPTHTLTRTYAGVAKGKNHQMPKTLHSVLITSKNKMDTAEKVIGKAKEILKPEKNRIQIERIRKVKDQRVIISCINEEETEQIKERIKNSEELEVERVKNKNPLVIIKEVKFKMTDNEIINAIKNQNPDICIEEGREREEIKIKYRRRTINTEKCHIIVQVTPEIWKKMDTKGHLYIEMERVKVEDQSPLIQCTRCLNFGHGKKFCSDSVDRCSHCGGLHLRAECPDRKAGVPPQCCNCTHNKAHSGRGLMSSDLGVNSGEPCKIYVTEHLSPEQKSLHAETRRVAKELKYKYVWVKFGQIYVRRNDSSSAVLIKNEDSLKKLS